MAGLSCIADRFSDPRIRASARADCVVCGAAGIALYTDLTDRFFGASGRWNFSRCSRPQCAMLWLNPMPLEGDIWKAYQNYYTHEDVGEALSRTSPRGILGAALQSIKRAYITAQLRHTDRLITWRQRMLGTLAYLDPTRRADTDFPLKHLPPEHRGRMLDLGCGSGELLGRMCALGWQAEGIDVDPAAAGVARRKGFRVGIGSLDEQNFPDASFDAVVMSHVVEHVHHPLELLKEIRRVLKPRRRLVIATPNARSLGHRLLGARWPFLDPPRHLQVFTSDALKSLVLAAGFADARTDTEIRTAAAMLPLIKWNRIAGRLFEYGESFALPFDRNAGEEIGLVAIK